MNSRFFIIPALAVLAVSVPVLAQMNQPGKMPQAPTQPPVLPQTPQTPSKVETPAAVAAPAAVPAAAVPDVPPHHCVAPKYPGALASNTTIKVFNTDYKAYADCIRAYTDMNRAWMAKIAEVNNSAVEEFNKFNAELKKQIDANQQ
jgi:hypothetical protein